MSAAPDRPQGGASDTPDAPAAGTGLAAVLLAAGEARRMQGINKLLLEIDGVPLVRRSARMLVRAGIEDIVVVLGHQADRVRAALGDPAGIGAAVAMEVPTGTDAHPGVGARTRITVIEHTGYRSGQHGSVLAGLAALPAGCAAALVMLGDMPLVDEADVARIAAAWQRRPQGCAVLVPAFEQRRGNPVLIGPPALAQIVRERPEGGARAWMDAHPQQVARCPMPDDHCVFDLDTPDDLARLEARLGRTVVVR